MVRQRSALLVLGGLLAVLGLVITGGLNGLAQDATNALHPATRSHVESVPTTHPGPLPDGESRKRRGGLFSRKGGS